MNWKLKQRNGLYLPDLDWFLDARKPVQKSFVSHAHFDHMGDHHTILCSPPTAELIQQRIRGDRNWRIYDFEEEFELEPGIKACLYPAGHIAGSAMLRLQKGDASFLYTGDFKLTPGISAEPCKPVAADTLVIETTYGIPRYTFPPEKEVFEDIIRFCNETLSNGDTPVLFGYSLGKSQAILRCLADAKLETMLHPTAFKLTQSCQKLGWNFPAYLPFDARNQKGRVIISPPMRKSSDWMKSIHNPKTAMISGWAIDSSATYRYQCDKAFPLSDHADYLDLQDFVDKVQPKEVFTVHGFAREFADTLRSQGYAAWALGRENQLGLTLENTADDPSPEIESVSQESPAQPSASPESLAAIALATQQLSSTDSHSRKLEILHALLAPLSPESAHCFILLLDTPELNTSGELPRKLVEQSLALASGRSEAEFKRLSKQAPELESLFPKNNKPSKPAQEICSFLRTLGSAPNPIFKQSLLVEQFKKLNPAEVVFLYRFLNGSIAAELDVFLLCQAISQKFQQKLSDVQSAYLRNGCLQDVSISASQGTLKDIRIQYFKPVRCIEASIEESPETVIEKQGLTLWSEQEHDGLRCQLHKRGEHAELYSKSGDRISHLFPELLEAARLIPQQFIADAVIVPWAHESALPKSELDRRLNRKGEELFLGEEVQVVLWLVDLLCLGEEDLLDHSIETRRQNLDTFTINATIRITPVTTLTGAEQIELALKQAKAAGSKGLLFKASQSPYNPLSQDPDWLRLS